MFKFLCGMTLVALVGIVASNLPDIKRYLRMRSM
ncbi:DUF6893 family small protein [Streptacidiphilus jiangxiensis]|jgi:hypothetical protein|uniref:Uncharacterized protein n=1 Tax=Streptacidiphilus jiangxiensis TaxID=235985 RepID=A0A1H7ND72_STRJI|nr:hypothetical protein SAMN05414137_106331 [Streptacidiphilus jiangxiensis]